MSETCLSLSHSKWDCKYHVVFVPKRRRTPGLLNSQNGRDHYPAVKSVLLAGGGVRGGQAIGVRRCHRRRNC